MYVLNYFFICLIFVSLSLSLPFKNLPYHTGLINDYNNHQKPLYKFLKNSSPLNNQSPNDRQSLPLISSLSNLNEQNKLDNNLNINFLSNNDLNNLKFNSNEQTIFLNKLKKENEIKENNPTLVSSSFPSSRLNNLRKHFNNIKNVKHHTKTINNLNDNHNSLQNEICPESSFSNNDLDVNSKAYLAPILFIGKLVSLSEDYSGQVAATFQVNKVVKTTNANVFNPITKRMHKVPIILKKGHQVVIHLVRKPGNRFTPPHCAVFMNSSSIGSLRLDQKYFVYGAAPLPSLQEIHKHSFGSVMYKVERVEQVNSTTNQTKSEFNSQNLVWLNNKYLPIKQKQLDSNETLDQNNSIKNKTNPSFFQDQFVIHYLSAFASPEPYNKKIYKSFAKNICKKCVKKPEVQGLNGDVHVHVKSKLSLRCKIFGNPQPWVEWYRNGKKLRNKGRFIIKNSKKISKLDITRVESSDAGYYECRTFNVASKTPAISKTRVIVVLSNKSKSNNKMNSNLNRNSMTTTPANLWPLIGQLCPINNYCLNGGLCTFFENVYEYVCQCADGFQGHRCENKDIYAFKKGCGCSPGYKGVRCEEKDISLNELINNSKPYSNYKLNDANYGY